MAKKTPSKKTSSKKVDTVDTKETINQLLDRVAVLEKKQSVLEKGLKWASDEISRMFGVSAVGGAFRSIWENLKKVSE